MNIEILLFLQFLWVLVISDEGEETDNEESSSNGLNWMSSLIPKNYKPNVPPSYNPSAHGATNATIISCSIIPKAITGISVKTMDFDVDLDIEIRWIDHRLQIPSEIPDNSTTVVPKSTTPNLWIPRISFRNCKLCDEFIFTRMNTISITPMEKELSVEFRKVFKFVCTFDLSNYPFDYQICFIKIDALYSNQFVILSNAMFEEEGEGHDVNLPPEFIQISYNVTDQDCSIVRNTSHGQRSCLKHTFIFRRVLAHYVMLMYGPSILIVTLSWVSFWFDVEAVAPRVALALTSLLTLATQFSNAQSNVPLVASIKAIDVWMFACIVMVFASLVEYAFANYYYRLKKANKVVADQLNANEQRVRNFIYFKPQMPGNTVQRHPYVKNIILETEEPKCRFRFCLRTKIDICPLDSVSRIFFPTVFAAFNAFYWTYYQSAGIITYQ